MKLLNVAIDFAIVCTNIKIRKLQSICSKYAESKTKISTIKSNYNPIY